MATYKRVSMNTSLRNARIFDDFCDDALDGDLSYPTSAPLDDRKPINTPFKSETKIELDFKLAVKKETNAAIKTEPLDPNPEDIPQNEMPLHACSSKQNTNEPKIDPFWNVKREVKHEASNEDSLLDVLPKLESKTREIFDENTNDEVVKDSCSSQTLKSGRKRVFTRLSPYLKLRSESMLVNEKVDQCVRKLTLHTAREYETDPVVLARRQKQIDFGKNTIGYDNYIRTVPRYKRTREEPSTPDKYRKYSRRGWDSLIKHWRLRLHNYD